MKNNATKKKPVLYLFTDIETDGTKYEGAQNQILEIACVLTDHNLNPIGKPFSSMVLPRGDFEYIRDNMAPIVLEMHTKNGLLNDLKTLSDAYFNRDGGVLSNDRRFLFVKRVETKLLDWLEELIPDKNMAPEIRMAGHSINSLDKPFIKAYMPELHGLLSHRTLDISSYVRFFTDCCEIPNDQIPFGLKEAGHRALDDTLMAINEAVKLRKWIIKAHEMMRFNENNNNGQNNFFGIPNSIADWVLSDKE